MTINLSEAVKIVKSEAQKEGFGVDSFCFESPEGWYFNFVDKKIGMIPPGFPRLMVSREGVFKRDFDASSSIPPDPIQGGREVDISEHLK